MEQPHSVTLQLGQAGTEGILVTNNQSLITAPQVHSSCTVRIVNALTPVRLHTSLSQPKLCVSQYQFDHLESPAAMVLKPVTETFECNDRNSYEAYINTQPQVTLTQSVRLCQKTSNVE